MDNRNTLTYKKDILDKLSKRQLKDAFELLAKLVVNTQDWHAAEKLSELETNYKYMLHYQFEDTIDPQKDVIYNTTLRTLYELTDDAWVCVRPSGTEPKVKFYYGVKGTSLADADEKSDAMGKAVLEMVDSMK